MRAAPHKNQHAGLRQRGQRSRDERVAITILLSSFVLGFARMAGALLARRAGLLPWLAGHPAAIAIFMPHTFIVPGAILAVVLGFGARRRALAELIEARGMLCLRCRYGLNPSSTSGTCPECGAPYDLVSFKRGWCRTYANLVYEVEWRTPEEGDPARAAAAARPESGKAAPL